MIQPLILQQFRQLRTVLQRNLRQAKSRLLHNLQDT